MDELQGTASSVVAYSPEVHYAKSPTPVYKIDSLKQTLVNPEVEVFEELNVRQDWIKEKTNRWIRIPDTIVNKLYLPTVYIHTQVFHDFTSCCEWLFPKTIKDIKNTKITKDIQSVKSEQLVYMCEKESLMLAVCSNDMWVCIEPKIGKSKQVGVMLIHKDGKCEGWKRT